MKMKIFLVVLCLLHNMTGHSQIQKGNWFLSGSLSYSKFDYASAVSAKYKQTDIIATPSVGYFLADKFATGVRGSYIYGSNNLNNSATTFEVGPFARYYLLSPEKMFNILVDAGYLAGKKSSNTGKYPSSSFQFSAGPVLYFNTSVGLEFLIGYSQTHYKDFIGNNAGIRVGIGFQFHLEQDK